MEKRLFCTLTLVILALFLAAPSTSQAEIALMDGKLILSGFVKNMTYYRLNGADREFKKGHKNKDGNYLSNHDTHFDFSNFSAYLEGVYSIKEDQESTFRIFGGLGPGMKWPRAMMTAWPATCIQKIARIINSRKDSMT